MDGVTEGRNVHYVAYNQRHLAALLIGVNPATDTTSESVDLAVFTSMSNVAGEKNFGIQFHQNVRYSDTKEPGTWHWIEDA